MIMEQILLINSVLLWIVVIFNLLVAFALARKLNEKSAAGDTVNPHVGLIVGEAAPDFVAETLQRQPVTLASFAGRQVLFLIISPNCAPCRESLSAYAATYDKAIASNTQMVLVSTGDREATQALVDEFKVTIPVIVAPHTTNTFLKDYKARGTPAYCLLDSEAKVLSAGYPGPNMGEWKSIVDSWEDAGTKSTQLALTESR